LAAILITICSLRRFFYVRGAALHNLCRRGHSCLIPPTTLMSLARRTCPVNGASHPASGQTVDRAEPWMLCTAQVVGRDAARLGDGRKQQGRALPRAPNTAGAASPQHSFFGTGPAPAGSTTHRTTHTKHRAERPRQPPPRRRSGRTPPRRTPCVPAREPPRPDARPAALRRLPVRTWADGSHRGATSASTASTANGFGR
jgi:hypothetical protein